MDQGILQALYNYNTYANRLVFETAWKLTGEQLIAPSSPSHESVYSLLLHMLGTEIFFLKVCQGQELPPRPETPPSLAEVRAFAEKLAGEHESYLASLDETTLLREVTFEMGGRSFHLPVWQLLTQAFVHSAHHRGELSIVLSGLGHPLPTLDIIIPFIRQSGQEWFT